MVSRPRRVIRDCGNITTFSGSSDCKCGVYINTRCRHATFSCAKAHFERVRGGSGIHGFPWKHGSISLSQNAASGLNSGLPAVETELRQRA